MPETPGERIKFMREAKGMTQIGLAAAVYTTQPAISQWENDKWLPAKASQVLLAEALGCSRTFLFGERVPA